MYHSPKPPQVPNLFISTATDLTSILLVLADAAKIVVVTINPSPTSVQNRKPNFRISILTVHRADCPASYDGTDNLSLA
jgi:hypothetical protein